MNLFLQAPFTSFETETTLEISSDTASELAQLDLACLIDIRQTFELELKGKIQHASHIPFFNIKQFLGFRLTDEEQEILDADEPNDLDLRSFIKAMNTLRQNNNCIFLLVCNSGRRSLCAARLLRELGYRKAFSVQGGFMSFTAK